MIEQHGFRLKVELYEQILYNIFINACKFNKKKGFIRVGVEAKLKKKGRSMSAFNQYGKEMSQHFEVMLITKITDTGIGMTKEKLNSLFKVFENVRQVSLHQETSTSLRLFRQDSKLEFQGVGLGLHLSLKLA